jgi:hypothetical protein
LIVAGLHPNITESDVEAIFLVFGEIDFVNLIREPETGLSKGFAFVQYASICHEFYVSELRMTLKNHRNFEKFIPFSENLSSSFQVQKSRCGQESYRPGQ